MKGRDQPLRRFIVGTDNNFCLYEFIRIIYSVISRFRDRCLVFYKNNIPKTIMKDKNIVDWFKKYPGD